MQNGFERNSLIFRFAFSALLKIYDGSYRLDQLVCLVATIAKQVYKQWKEGKSEGVSKWLFIGQIAASLGFAVYSYLVWNPVFIFTNSLMVLNGIAGLVINLYLKQREAKEA